MSVNEVTSKLLTAKEKENFKMIKFTNKDDNKQFISIKTDKNINIDLIVDKIRKQFPSLKQLHIVFDEAEILIPIESGFAYGFSLNQLRDYIKPIAAVTISHFAVDIGLPAQRYCG